jgi:hypothetical protein
MRVKLNAWPEGTEDYVSHSVMSAYIQDTSKKSGVHDITIYGARVKDVSKNEGVWEITWSKLEQENGELKELETTSVRTTIYLLPDQVLTTGIRSSTL